MSDLLVFVIALVLLFVPAVLIKAYILQRSGQNVVFLSRVKAVGVRVSQLMSIGSVIDIDSGDDELGRKSK